MEILILKHRAVLQEHPVSRLERDLIDLVQCLERLAFRLPAV